MNYESPNGDVPYETWADSLDIGTRVRIGKRINKLRHGNLGDHKSVGGGVVELREDFGPGYRIYIGQQGEELVILLGGGSKSRQQADIDAAKERWREYLAQPDDDTPPTTPTPAKKGRR